MKQHLKYYLALLAYLLLPLGLFAGFSDFLELYAPKSLSSYRFQQSLNQIKKTLRQPFKNQRLWIQTRIRKNRIAFRRGFPFVQGLILPPNSQIISIGDIHGDIWALKGILTDLYHQGKIDSNLKLAEDIHIVATGDYTDRLWRGAQVWSLLTALQIENPGQVHLLRGNHETKGMAEIFGLYDELFNTLTWSEEEDIAQAYRQLLNIFNLLPHALFIATPVNHSRKKYRVFMFCHGGIGGFKAPGQRPVVFNPQQLLDTLLNPNKVAPSVHGYPTLYQKLTYQSRCVLRRGPHFYPTNNWFLGNDFMSTLPLERRGSYPSMRTSKGPPLYKIHTYEYAKRYLTRYSRKSRKLSYQLDGIIRGHQHHSCGVVKLNSHPWQFPSVIQGGNDLRHTWRHSHPERETFLPFERKRYNEIQRHSWSYQVDEISGNIERFSIYTCTSSLQLEADCWGYAYIHLRIDDTGSWEMTPHYYYFDQNSL